MDSYSLDDYKKAGCYEPMDIIMVAVYHISAGKVCDGCPRNFDGACPAFLTLTKNEKKKGEQRKEILPTVEFTETVREEAQRLNTSIKKVRARRREAINEEITKGKKP